MTPELARAASLAPWQPGGAPPEGATVAAIAGGLVLLGLFLALARLAPPRALAPSPGASPSTGWRTELSALGLGLLTALLVTWPMAASQGLVQRNMDAYGSAGLLAAAAGSGPLPERVDTVLFVLLGAPLVPLLGPVGAVHGATLLGVALSFHAAEWAARRGLGLGRPASLLAGLAWCSHPLLGTALADGHGGWLVAPGLPLLLGALARSARSPSPREGPWRTAALVTGAGLLCALQSGYVGVMAALAVGLLGLLWRLPLGHIAALGLPAALLYGLVFFGLDAGEATTGGAGPTPASDAASLATLLGQPPGTGLLLGHARHALPPVLFSAGVLLPLLRRDRVGRGLALLALVAVALSLGGRLHLGPWPGEGLGPAVLPWAGLQALLPLDDFRFPSRFLWLALAAAALGAARSAAGLSRARAGVLAALVLLEGLLLGARPWEPREVRADAPVAHAALPQGARVLELWPDRPADALQGAALEELACFGALDHGRPPLGPCVDLVEGGTPAQALGAELLAALRLGGPAPAGLLPSLRDAGADGLAWHADAFRAEELAPLRAGLVAWLGPPLAEGDAGGEQVVVWALPQRLADGVAPGLSGLSACAPGALAAPPPRRSEPHPAWLLLFAALGLGLAVAPLPGRRP